MPDFWTHILGGELVTKELSVEKKYIEMIKDNQQLFNLGCEGPDIFFYNDFWPWISNKRGPELGKKLHQQRIIELFDNSLSFLAKNQTREDYPKLFAYLSGLIVHYALDKKIHPFIYQETDNYPEHKRLELNIDTYLSNKYWHKKAAQLTPHKAIDVGADLPQIIKDYYTFLLAKFNYNFAAEVLTDAYQDFKQVFSLFHSRWGIKKSLFKLINPLVSFDLSTLIYPQETNYKLLANEDYTRVEELLLESVKDAQTMLKKVIKFLANPEDIKVEEIFPKINFDGQKIK